MSARQSTENYPSQASEFVEYRLVLERSLADGVTPLNQDSRVLREERILKNHANAVKLAEYWKKVTKFGVRGHVEQRVVSLWEDFNP